MKKRVIVFLFMMLFIFVEACGSSDSSEPAESKIVLVNNMTDGERERVDKHKLTLLDAPETKASEEKEYKVSVEYKTTSQAELMERLEKSKDMLTTEQYEEASRALKEMVDGITERKYVLVNGKIMFWIPSAQSEGLNGEEFYDGGRYTFNLGYYDDDGNYIDESKDFADFEEYLSWIKTYLMEHYGYSKEKAEQECEYIKAGQEAIVSGNVEELPEGTVDPSDPKYFDSEDEFADYRDKWEFDRSEVEKIKDYIDEYSIYDEEMDIEYLVHVTLPPDYDKEKTYPVFFLTDGVWRFGNHTELRKLMENGEAAPVILVSLGYNYHLDGSEGNFRGSQLVLERKKLLDFITDNLMPYLGEQYKIDYASSTLYGHSDGGVFAHYALFNSDKYENRPFGKYIIGSPAFWGLYDRDPEYDLEGCLSDYGYFDRNEKLDKSVFLCAGSEEDPDYADEYNGHPTTLEGLASLKERLESKGADVKYKLYDSHHYQYIPEMLCEYLRETYPAK